MLQPFNDFEQIDLPRRNSPPPEPFMPINLDCSPPPLLVHARSYSNINSAALLNTLYIPSILQPLSLAFHSKPPPPPPPEPV